MYGFDFCDSRYHGMCGSLVCLVVSLVDPFISIAFESGALEAIWARRFSSRVRVLPSSSSINKLMNTAFSGLAVFAIMSILNLFTACIYLGQVMTYIHGHCLGSRYRFRPQTFRIRWGASLPFVLGSLNLLVSCLPISSPSNCSYRSNLGLPIVSNLILARVMLIVH